MDTPHPCFKVLRFGFSPVGGEVKRHMSYDQLQYALSALTSISDSVSRPDAQV